MESAPAVAPGRPCRRRHGPLLAALILLPLLAAGGVSLALYLLADAEAIRQQAQQALGRPVTLAGLAPGFLSVGLVGLEVGDTAGFAPDPLLRLERADISPDWGALLRGELRIARITLTGARIVIEADTYGRRNIDDLLQPSGGTGSAVRLSAIGFDSCSVTYATPERQLTIAGVSGTVSNLDDTPLRLDLAAASGGGRLRLSGHYAPTAIALQAQAEELPLLAFGLPADLFATPQQPLLTGTLSVSCAGDSAMVRGRVNASGLLREADIALTAPWPLPSDSIAQSLRGTIVAAADARELRALKLLAPALDAIDAAGTVTAMLALDTATPALEQVVFSFRDCSLAVPALKHRLEHLNGPFRVGTDALRLQPVTFTVAGLPFRGQGIIGFAPFTLDLDITGDNLDLARAAALTAEPLLPEGISVDGNGSAMLDVARHGEETVVSGTLKPAGASARFTSPALELTGIGGTIGFRGSELAFEQVSARACGGAITLDGRIGETAAGMPFAITLQADALALQPLAAAFGAPQAATGGTLTGNITLSGYGGTTASYNGRGQLRVQQPRFADLPALAKLAPYLGLRDATLLSRFDSGSVSFTISKGALTLTEPLHLGNERVALAVTGSIGLDGPLNLRGQARVPSSSLAGIIGGVPLSALGGVRNEGDKTVIGFRIGGTYGAPSFGPDLSPGNILDVPAAVLNAPVDLAGSIGRLLRRGSTDTAPAPAPPAPEGTTPVPPLRELNDLFRRRAR